MTMTTFKLLIFTKNKEYPQKHEISMLFIINSCKAFLYTTYMSIIMYFSITN